MSRFTIETKQLNFSHDKSKNEIENLNLKVPKGSVYGFLGPNGSGKSTTIRLLLSLLKKQSGKVLFFGEPFNKKSRLSILSRVSALIEAPSLYDHLSAVDNLKIAANYRQIKHYRIDDVLAIVKLTGEKNKKIKEYSLGMKQRLGIAISLLSSPELIILDEPTNGLDPKGIRDIRALIKDLNENYGTTIFISSHLLSEIEKTCTHVGIIRCGKLIFQDTVSMLKYSHGTNLKIEFEVDNPPSAILIINNLKKGTATFVEGLLRIELTNKVEISVIVDALRAEKIHIHQIMIKNNLEELFLSLTEN